MMRWLAPVATWPDKQFHAVYAIKPDKQLASDLDIQSNFRVAFDALGTQLFYEDATSTYARLETADKTTWLKVTSEEGDYTLDIVDEQPIAPPRAASVVAALVAQGVAPPD